MDFTLRTVPQLKKVHRYTPSYLMDWIEEYYSKRSRTKRCKAQGVYYSKHLVSLDYHREAIIPYEKMFEVNATTEIDEKVILGGHSVRFSSRVHLLVTTPFCCECHLPLEYFAIETTFSRYDKRGSKMFHINGYGLKNGEEIMLTRDHIIPISKLPREIPNNYQTLCRLCNVRKANSNSEDLRL
jgi:hypothetical protein